MDLELRDKIVLVTGGSKGIGLACAKAFLAEGAILAIASRSETNLANARRVLGTALTIPADCVDADAALDVVDRVERELGPVDVLVNSAGAASSSTSSVAVGRLPRLRTCRAAPPMPRSCS